MDNEIGKPGPNSGLDRLRSLRTYVLQKGINLFPTAVNNYRQTPVKDDLFIVLETRPLTKSQMQRMNDLKNGDKNH